MPIFMMFGKYTAEASRGISAERTSEAKEIIKSHGGKVVSMYAVLGEHDLVLTLDLPSAEAAIATSAALNSLTGISFTTSPVVEVEKFDRLISRATDI
ncbi:MAG: GYD domain-containing protein [Gammaproteobacteria bacterium]|nr:GYD domain-containing protein [Gammaproteobacteria bacterium]MDJ0871139.1 GYD domain-containing protein [Gammaproteobacteria bacterium]